jgi:hypothetical protein
VARVVGRIFECVLGPFVQPVARVCKGNPPKQASGIHPDVAMTQTVPTISTTHTTTTTTTTPTTLTGATPTWSWTWDSLLQECSNMKTIGVLVMVMRVWMVHMMDVHPTIAEVLAGSIDVAALRAGKALLMSTLRDIQASGWDHNVCMLQQINRRVDPTVGIAQISRASLTLLGSIHRRTKLSSSQLNYVAMRVQKCQREVDVLALLLSRCFQKRLGIGTDGARALLVIVARYTHRFLLCSVSHARALCCHARRQWPHTMAVFDTLCSFWRSKVGVSLLALSPRTHSLFQSRPGTVATRQLLSTLLVCVQCEAVYTCVQHMIGGTFKPQAASMLDFSQTPPVSMCRHCLGVTLTGVDLSQCSVVTSTGYVYQMCTRCDVRFVDTSMWFEACSLVLCLQCRST